MVVLVTGSLMQHAENVLDKHHVLKRHADLQELLQAFKRIFSAFNAC